MDYLRDELQLTSLKTDVGRRVCMYGAGRWCQHEPAFKNTLEGKTVLTIEGLP